MKLVKRNYEEKNKRKEREELKRKFKPKFEPVFAGMRRCIICGYAFAKGEENNHKHFHSSFITAKQNEGNAILTHKEIECMQLDLINIMNTNKKESKEEYSELVLSLIYNLEYNYSQRFWEYGKPHPTMEEYIRLLWNTKSFLLKLKKFLPNKILLNKIRIYISDKSLKESSSLFIDSFVYTEINDTTGIDEEIINLLKEKDNEVSNSLFYKKNTKQMKLNTQGLYRLFTNKIA